MCALPKSANQILCVALGNDFYPKKRKQTQNTHMVCAVGALCAGPSSIYIVGRSRTTDHTPMSTELRAPNLGTGPGWLSPPVHSDKRLISAKQMNWQTFSWAWHQKQNKKKLLVFCLFAIELGNYRYMGIMR